MGASEENFGQAFLKACGVQGQRPWRVLRENGLEVGGGHGFVLQEVLGSDLQLREILLQQSLALLIGPVDEVFTSWSMAAATDSE